MLLQMPRSSTTINLLIFETFYITLIKDKRKISFMSGYTTLYKKTIYRDSKVKSGLTHLFAGEPTNLNE